MKTRGFVVFFLLLTVVIGSYAQDVMPFQNRPTTKRKLFYYTDSMKYSRNEQWYVQLQGGLNCPLTENIGEGSVGDALSPWFVLTGGKYFTSIWGMRLQFMHGENKGRYFDGDNPYFSFRNFNALAEVTFNITNFIPSAIHGEESRWNVFILLGPGLSRTYDFKDTRYPNYYGYTYNYSPTFHFIWLAGMELSYNINYNWNINLEAHTIWSPDRYNGLTHKRPLDGMVNAFLGVRYTFGKFVPKW